MRLLGRDLALAYDESIVGALARACRGHRLRHLDTVLEGTGLRLLHPGAVQRLDEASLERLATALRCDRDGLVARRWTADPERRGLWRMGAVTLPHAALEMRRRLIGPKSLSAEPHHRAAWMNRLLPYCPVTLERLVDSCPRCGPLGWRVTRGIAACETCGEDVPASPDPGLAEGGADGYRLLAALMSPDGAVAASAAARLPQALRGRPPTALVRVALRAVAVLPLDGRGRIADRDFLRLPPADLGSLVSRAGGMLLDWPEGIRAVVRHRERLVASDLEGYQRLRSDLKWVGSKEVSESGSAEAMAAAFPRLHGRITDSLAVRDDYYTATQVRNLLLIDTEELTRLRESRIVRCVMLPGTIRVRARYDVADVERVRSLLETCSGPGETAATLGLPVYAIDKLIWSGLLSVQDDPAIIALRGPQIVTAGIEDLESRLVATACTHAGDAPDAVVGLRSAMVRFPGEKPWAHVVQALLDRRLPFRLVGDGPVLRRVRVAPAAVALLDQTLSRADRSGLGITMVSQRDATEILGTGWDEMVHALRTAEIAIVPHGKGRGVDRARLSDLAGTVAFTAEVAARLGYGSARTYRLLNDHGLRRLRGGWARADLAAAGLRGFES